MWINLPVHGARYYPTIMNAIIPSANTLTAVDENAAAIADMRCLVDELDTKLIELLAKRQSYTDTIGRLKPNADAIPAYERLFPMLIARAMIAESHGLNGDVIARIFDQLAQHSMQRQQASQSTIKKNNLPLIYSCSGCSSAAQLANDLAIAFDREQRAEMSCVAGVGANIRSLTKKAMRARKRIVLDGCQLSCARQCLQQHNIPIDEHVVLSDLGIEKCLHENYRIKESIVARQYLSQRLSLIVSTSEHE